MILTPKFLSVNLRVFRIAWRRASGFGWVRAVRIPRPPAFETAATSSGTPTLNQMRTVQCSRSGLSVSWLRRQTDGRTDHCMPPCTTGLQTSPRTMRLAIYQIHSTSLRSTYTRMLNNLVSDVTIGIVPEFREE